MADPQQTSPAPQPPSFLEWLKTVPIWQKVKKFWKLIAGTGIASIVLYFLSILANLSQIGMNWALQLTWDWICRAVPFVLISLTIAFLAAFAYYLWFIKKTKKLYYIIPIGLLISLGLTAIIFLGFKPSDLNHVKIVVANFYNFDKGEDKDNEVTDMVFGDLKKALRPFSDVEVEPLGTAITEPKGGSDTANKLGQERQADIVIWGSYVEKSDGKQLRTNFDVMTSTGKLKYMPTLGEEAQGEVRLLPAELKSFSLTLKLSQEMTYLSLFTVGMARYSADDWDDAIAGFTSALSKTTEDVSALSKGVVYTYRGRAYGMKGNSDLAIQDYTKALELNPKYALAYTYRGRAYGMKGNSDLAIQDYTKALELNPKYADAYNNRGYTYSRQGNYDFAIQDFNKALELDLKPVNVYTNRGFAYGRQGNSDLAIQDFNKALELDPKYADAYNNRGNAYYKKGNADLAIQDFNKALEFDPKFAAAYNNRGFAYGKKGNYDLAIQDYNKALELDPKPANVYTNRGFAYGRQGNYDLAIQDFNKALELDPKYADAYNNRGYTYSRQGNSDLAIQDFNKALELDPKDVDAYNNRGNAYLSKGENDRAIKDFDEAIRLDPKYAVAYANRGNAYSDKGNSELAIQNYTKAIELDLKFAKAYTNRGIAYAKKGEMDKAIADYREALKLTNDPSMQQDLEKRLRELGAQP